MVQIKVAAKIPVKVGYWVTCKRTGTANNYVTQGYVHRVNRKSVVVLAMHNGTVIKQRVLLTALLSSHTIPQTANPAMYKQLVLAGYNSSISAGVFRGFGWYWPYVVAHVTATKGLSFLGLGVTLNVNGKIPIVGVANNCPPNCAAATHINGVSVAPHSALIFTWYPVCTAIAPAITKVIKQYPIVIVISHYGVFKVVQTKCGKYNFAYSNHYNHHYYHFIAGPRTPTRKLNAHKVIPQANNPYRYNMQGLTAVKAGKVIACQALGVCVKQGTPSCNNR